MVDRVAPGKQAREAGQHAGAATDSIAGAISSAGMRIVAKEQVGRADQRAIGVTSGTNMRVVTIRTAK
jgi:hypothetical protein